MLRGSSVLVTGGSGSFGHAFIRWALAQDVKQLVSFSRNATLRYQLRQAIIDPRLLVLAGDVTDSLDLDRLPQIDVIVHAAAEKHIDTGERQEYWVRKINTGGAQRVIDFALKRGITCVVALSTDKACNPVNAYGRSKADAEYLFTRYGFTVVRYGNVVASAGSVLPLFLEQRKAGRLTVTDRRMTRYFMALSDDAPFTVRDHVGPVMSAVGLVRYALEHGRGGEIFIPQIPSGTIWNLAEQVGPGCVIEEVGIRPGEKLHEELIHPSESPRCWRTVDGVYVLMPDINSIPSLPAQRVPLGFAFTSADDPLPLEVLEVAA